MVRKAGITQFDVFENPNRAQRDGFPYLVVMQNDQLDGYSTLFVMPLTRLAQVPSALPRRLTQTVNIAGETVYPAAHLSAPLPKRILGSSTGSLRGQAGVLRDALDAVVSGV